MDRTEIMKLLPHRNSMLLLDEVTKNGDEAEGIYRIKGTEFFLDGHFPGFPIVPGVILCEILAQTACVLLEGALDENSLPVYAGLDKVRFRSPVHPGDEFRTKCRITKSKGPFYFAEGEGYAGGNLAITASFSFAIAGKDQVCSQRS